MKQEEFIIQRPVISGARRRPVIFDIIGLFFLIILFLSGFFLSRAGVIYITGETAEKIIWQELTTRTGQNWAWAEKDEEGRGYLLTYRPVGETGPYTLGRVPLTAVVNFWNPLPGLSSRELEALVAGEITGWEQLGGEKRPVNFYFYSPRSYPYLAEIFPRISPRALLLDSQEEVAQRVAEDPWGFGILTPQAVIPAVKVLPVDGRDPLWEPQSYPLAAQAVLLPPPGDFFYDWPGGRFLRDLLLRRAVKKAFSSAANPTGLTPVTLAAAGDILLARGVADTMEREKDYSYPLARTAEIFRRADLAFANLECPLSTRGSQINMFRGKPEYIEALTHAGFNLISLANNHILDYGVPAMLDTMEHLAAAGIVHVGVGENIVAARRPRIIEVKGVKIAFLAYTEVGEGFTYTRIPHHWAATSDLPGAAPARADYLRSDAQTARQEADLVIVSMHWGKEYEHQPTDFQKALGRIAVDAGADLVIGHHPHVIQGIEFRRRGVIVYSLGNFVFDQKAYNRRQGLILQAVMDRGGLRRISFIPILIVQEQPRVATGKLGCALLNLLAGYSAALNGKPEK